MMILRWPVSSKRRMVGFKTTTLVSSRTQDLNPWITASLETLAVTRFLSNTRWITPRIITENLLQASKTILEAATTILWTWVEVTTKRVNKMAAQILLSCRQRKIAGRISRERRELALPLSKRLLDSLVEPQGQFKLLMALFSLGQVADQRPQVVSIPPYKMEEIHIHRWHRTLKTQDLVIIQLDKTQELQQKPTRITWV